MKKLKNPRKYVERLKKNVEQWKEMSRRNFNDFRRERGRHWISLRNDSRHVFVIHPEAQSELRIGRKLRIEAEIIEYSGTKERIEVTVGLQRVLVVEE